MFTHLPVPRPLLPLSCSPCHPNISTCEGEPSNLLRWLLELTRKALISDAVANQRYGLLKLMVVRLGIPAILGFSSCPYHSSETRRSMIRFTFESPGVPYRIGIRL